MSIWWDYRPWVRIRANDLLDGRLERFGVRQKMTDETSDIRRCLTDGKNSLWVHIDDEGFATNLERLRGSGNDPDVRMLIPVLAIRIPRPSG